MRINCNPETVADSTSEKEEKVSHKNTALPPIPYYVLTTDFGRSQKIRD